MSSVLINVSQAVVKFFKYICSITTKRIPTHEKFEIYTNLLKIFIIKNIASENRPNTI